MLACPFGDCRDSERSELAQTPDTALRIDQFKERKVERMSTKQKRNREHLYGRYPGHPDYKAGSRKANGQYRDNQTVCRMASLPRRARRGV